MNVLTDPIIGMELKGGPRQASLPETFAALAADDVLSFANLRPHQRHPWHAFLCQLGAIACLRAGLQTPPDDTPTWTQILRALTPEFPEDEPWRLVSPPEKPALLQAPVAGGNISGWTECPTPDFLDALVISRNHDLKRQRLFHSKPDDWIYALVARQTFDGASAAGQSARYHPMSRMNSESGNRCGIGLAPRGGVGAHVMRDVRRLIALRQRFLDDYPRYGDNGPALLWLIPWDGSHSLSLDGLDPYYIEVGRRLRLCDTHDGFLGFISGSKVARIAMSKAEGGITGDAWTPIDMRGADHKALTVDARGFDYRRLTELMFSPAAYEPAPLQIPGPGEGGDGWSLVCRALVRGQGKTEGYHERRVPIPAKIIGRIRLAATRGELGALAEGRIKQADAVRGALRYGLMVLYENGPEEFKPKDKSAERHADPLLGRFQSAVDRDFFEFLFVEAQADSEAAGRQARRDWLMGLLTLAQGVLRAAETGSPTATVRRYRALVRAGAALRRSFYSNKEIRLSLEGVEYAA